MSQTPRAAGAKSRTGSGPLGRLDRAVGWANGRLEDPKWAWTAVLAATLAVLALRLPAALAAPAGGADYGHYLATAHWLTGAEPSQFGHEGLYGYHLILVALVLLFPEPTATAVSGPLVAALLVPAAFVLARRALSPLLSLGVAGALPLQQNISDMVAWGGNPNLLAISFSLVMWRFVVEAVEAPGARAGRRPAALAGTFLGLTVLTHSFTAFMTLVALALFAAAALSLRVSTPGRLARAAVVLGAVAALVSLPAVPTYLTTATSGVLYSPPPGSDSVESLMSSLGYLFRDTPLVWAAAAVAVTAAAGMLVWRRKPFGLFLALSLAVPVALATTLFAGNMNRALYYLDVPFTFGLGFGAAALWRGRGTLSRLPAALRQPAVVAVLVAVLVLVPTTSVSRHEAAIDFYVVLTDEHLEAMDWIRSNSEPSDGVWTDGVAKIQPYGRTGQMYGFWLDGYARRPSLYTAQPEDLAFDYEQQRARDATRILQGDIGAENGVLRVGVGPDLASTYNPTVGLRDGADYRPVFVGLDIGLEAGARTHYLTAGADPTPTAAEEGPSAATYRQRSTFVAPNNWSGSASAVVTLADGAVTYEVTAAADGTERPWIHQDFLVGPGLRLVDRETSDGGLNQSFEFEVQRSGRTTSTLRVTVSAAGENASLGVRVLGGELAPRLAVAVSGTSAHPQLRVRVEWPDGAELYGPPGAVEPYRAHDLLEGYGVRYLFIENAQGELIRRFALQPEGYRTAFANAAVTVIERSPAA